MIIEHDPKLVTEREREEAANAYVMTLMAAMVGLPLPIVNLIACIIYYAVSKPKTIFAKYNVTQAIISQIPVICINSVGLTWTLKIIFSDTPISNLYVAYMATMLMANLLDYAANIAAAVKARKGKLVMLTLFGPLAWAIVNKQFSGSIWRRVFIDFIVSVALFGASVYGINQLDLVPKEIKLSVTIPQEEKLGELITKAILKTETIIENEEIESAMDTVFAGLNKSIDSTQFHYKIYVIQKDEVNAITLPGGNIIVYSGLLKFTKTPEEFAAVLAHEMGHVEHRDVIYKLGKDIGISVLVAVVVRSDYGVLRKIAQTLLSSVFTREQEAEADHFAFEHLSKAGISPIVMASFFERLENEKQSYNEKLELLMSHPHNKKRIKAALDYKLPADFQTKPINLDWQQVLNNLK